MSTPSPGGRCARILTPGHRRSRVRDPPPRRWRPNVPGLTGTRDPLLIACRPGRRGRRPHRSAVPVRSAPDAGAVAGRAHPAGLLRHRVPGPGAVIKNARLALPSVRAWRYRPAMPTDHPAGQDGITRPRVIVSVTATADGRVTLTRMERMLDDGPNLRGKATWPRDGGDLLMCRASDIEQIHHPTVPLDGSGSS